MISSVAQLFHSAILRGGFLPRIYYRIWKFICRLNEGSKFFFEVNIFKKKMIYGGVCGLSDEALYMDWDKHESEVTPVFKELLLLDPRPVILDIGANNGQSLLKFKAICDTCVVHCFEPFPELANLLNELIKKNFLKDVLINQELVGKKVGINKLYYRYGDTLTASAVDRFQPFFNSSMTIETTTIDNYVHRKKIDHITLIKIDVEGGELEVLKGACKTLMGMKPPLIIEFLYTENKFHLIRQKKAISLLEEIGYKFYHIKSGGVVHRESVVSPDPAYVYLNYFVSAS